MNATNIDIRWQQRFSNYRKALIKLSDAVMIVKEQLKTYENQDTIKEIDELVREGLIQRFEYTHELAWNVMKDYAIYQGYPDIAGSRDAIRQAIFMNIIEDKRWMHTIADRNRTSHIYDEETAYEIMLNVINVYHSLFCAFEEKMSTLIDAYTLT